MAELKRVSLRISEELYTFLSEEAEKEGLSMNAIAIFALNSYKAQRQMQPSVAIMQQLIDLAKMHES